MSDGLLGKCKECTKRDSRSNRDENVEYYRAYDRHRAYTPKRVKGREDYQKTERGQELRKLNANAWRKRNPDRSRAHRAVRRAIQKGGLVRQPCRECGSPNAHAHHHDYSKPLDVEWMCHSCHMRHHKEERDQERLEKFGEFKMRTAK